MNDLDRYLDKLGHAYLVGQDYAERAGIDPTCIVRFPSAPRPMIEAMATGWLDEDLFKTSPNRLVWNIGHAGHRVVRWN